MLANLTASPSEYGVTDYTFSGSMIARAPPLLSLVPLCAGKPYSHWQPQVSLILVVDDNADTGDLLVRLLRRVGMPAVAEGSAHGALAYLSADDLDELPSLVILDVMMPAMDGIACLRAIRAEPAWEGVPVLMYTADYSVERMNEALGLGAVGYAIKGVIRWDDFLTLIRQHANGDEPDVLH
jgi:CheY-like chemotaxis protein